MCRSSRVPCSTPTRDGISAAPPRCSSEYTSRACQAERVCIRRTTGRWCRNPSQEGVEHGTRLDLHILGLSKRGQSGRDTVINMQRWTIMHIYKFVSLPDGIWLGLRDWLGDLDKNKPMQQERRKSYTLEAWSVAGEEAPQRHAGPAVLAGEKLRRLKKHKH